MIARGRWFVACAAIMASAAPVAAQPAPDAPATTTPKGHGGKLRPDNVKQAAREAFEAATAADAAGKLPEAIRQYRRAIDISPHPNTYYNLADVLRRSGDIISAMHEYGQYLALAPDAPDRGAVEALIDQLEHTPGLVTIDSKEPRGKVFVDGRPVGDAPITLELQAGQHQVDLITPITYGHDICSVSQGSKQHCEVNAKPRVDGNIVLSGSVRLGGIRWKVNDVEFQMKGRFEVPKGAYPLQILDKAEQCEPLWVGVNPLVNDDVQYIFVEAPPQQTGPGPRECHKLTTLVRNVHFSD